MDIRKAFPIFEQHQDLVYLDNAATTHKPRMVIDSMVNYLIKENGSPNRGAHSLSVKSTGLYDAARLKVKNFIGARFSEEIIFTRNTTESLNLLAYTYGMTFVEKGQKLVVTITSHHSNILPWQMVAEAKEAELVYMYCDKEGRIPDEEFDKIDERTALVAFPYVSNALGIIHPVERLIQKARKHQAIVVLDAAQAVGHFPIQVTKLDVDFMAFSGHKVFGPQGIGVLYGKKELLNKMPPFNRGGDMIDMVMEQGSTFAELPKKFEGGTQNVTGAVGLGAALDFINEMGISSIHEHEMQLTEYCYNALKTLPFISLLGPLELSERSAIILFNVDGIHPHDVASILDGEGIAIRAGHHCCQPLMKYLDIYASCRVSFSIYNVEEDVDRLVQGLKKVREVFGYVD